MNTLNYNTNKIGNSDIGMGNSTNPNVPDMPLGFGMALFQDSKARNNYENLSDENKTNVIKYIQDSKSGNEAKNRIKTTILNLSENNNDFI